MPPFLSGQRECSKMRKLRPRRFCRSLFQANWSTNTLFAGFEGPIYGSGLRFFDSRSMRGPLWYHERERRRIEGLTVSKPGEIEARLGYVYAASGWRAMAQEKLNEI